MLKHENNLEHILTTEECPVQKDKDNSSEHWILEDINYHKYLHKRGGKRRKEPAEPEFRGHSYLSILGFHPFQETVFFNSTLTRGLAYDLNSSKVRDLGNMSPKYYTFIGGQHACLGASFLYTPCWMEDPLPSRH